MDVVVVGAGVVGCSTALALAQDGLAVTVVDSRGAPGQGSTSASSAIVRFNYSSYDGVALAWEAGLAWRQWAHGEPPHATFHRVGLVMLDSPVAPVDRQTALFDRCEIPWEHWDPATLEDRVPGIAADRCWPPRALDDERFGEADGSLGALWTPDAGYVDDPALAAVNLASAARVLGVQFVHGRTVVAVEDGVVLDDGSVVRAPVQVNAAGPWSGRVNALAGVGAAWSVTTRPLRQEVHHVPSVASTQVVADLDLGTYSRPSPGGTLLGGTEPECDPLHWLDDPDDLGSPVSQWDAQTTRVARRFPDLGIPSRPSGIVGVYDVTEDWTPVYDATERPGFFAAVGTSGNQFKNAPVIGQVMAARVRGESTWTGPRSGLTVDLRAFAHDRPRNAASTGTVMG